MLTVQILVKNNKGTIENTLKSLSTLNAKIVVGDIGSTDGTVEICLESGADVKKINWGGDYSKARNSLIQDDMNFYIEPWEVLAKGHEEIALLNQNSRVYVLQNGIASKELRIWKDIQFKNPVYETLVDEESICCPNIIILSENAPDLREEKFSKCEDWIKKRPTSPEPYYYMACSCLAKRKYNYGNLDVSIAPHP
jgi:glycosyltransferase involved in cell wall biosynthesis